jgi:hypothetical protein
MKEIHRKVCWLLLSFLVLYSGANSGSALQVIDLKTPPLEVGRFQKFEISFNLDKSFDNPFDSEQIDICAVFTRPDGQTDRIFAFYTQDFQFRETPVRIQKRDGSERDWPLREYIPSSGNYWQARYTPTMTGKFLYHLEVGSDKGEARHPESGELEFNCLPSDRKGFIRPDPDNYHYLRFDDGSSYFGIGFNSINTMGSCIQGRVRIFDILKKSTPFGANIAQIDLGQGDYLEWSKISQRGFPYYDAYEGLGRYNLQVASQIDSAINLAEDLGVYLRFTFYHWADFTPELYFAENTPGFQHNPYSQQNGGPCRRPIDFLSNPRALRYQEQLLRYIVARWGYSPNIMCWEFWGEVENLELENPALYDENTVIRWHQKFTDYLHKYNPNHMVSTSFQNVKKSLNLFRQVDCDVVTFHKYTSTTLERPFEIVDNMMEQFGILKEFRKPIMPEEFSQSSYDNFGPVLNLPYDENGIHLHQQLWASLMVGGAICAMHWDWQEYIDRYNLYYHCKGITNFLKNEDLSEYQYSGETKVSVRCSNKNLRYIAVDIPSREVKQREGKRPRPYFSQQEVPEARALGLVGESRALVWVYDQGSSFIADNLSDSLNDVTLIIESLSQGIYSIEYWDTMEGSVISTGEAEVINGQLTLNLPSFHRDLALKIRHQ